MRASGTGSFGTPPSETLIWCTCGCVIPMLGAHCTKIRSPVRFSSAFPLLNFFVYYPASRHDTVGLKATGADNARLEEQRAANEDEMQRTTRTHEELTNSLQAAIAKRNIKIKQVRDRLTINMVDRVPFDSGQSQVKPAGLQVLKQVSDILKNVTDKQIRIEGHTDNVPIGARLRERFPTNWELSTARATSVVRYLIEEGGVDRATLLAVGYADTRPLAGNDTEEGRTANRRIEIALYPKDLSEIASQLKP